MAAVRSSGLSGKGKFVQKITCRSVGASLNHRTSLLIVHLDELWRVRGSFCSQRTFEIPLYLGTGSTSRVLHALSLSARNTVCSGPYRRHGGNITTLPNDELSTSTLPDVLLVAIYSLMVLDLTAWNNVVGPSEFSSFYLHVLSFMKFIVTSKLHITGSMALSSWSAPVDLYHEGLDLL